MPDDALMTLFVQVEKGDIDAATARDKARRIREYDYCCTHGRTIHNIDGCVRCLVQHDDVLLDVCPFCHQAECSH